MQGAYVVRIGDGKESDQEDLSGRVEEVDSGRSMKFGSGAELLEFLRERQRDTATEQTKEQ